MDRSLKGILFLGMLILALLFLLLTGPFMMVEYVPMLLVQIFGLLLIIWAILARLVNKQPKAHLPSGYFFITKGPYEILRHPIYAGLLLFSSSLVQYEFTLLRAWAFIVLSVVIVCKILYEENVMRSKIKEYHKYENNTKRLIPYLF